MRIIAGAARGRRLVAPRGRVVRPTTDRVKEALFSSLAPRLHAARVLDLYAGSGALGLEALSRGAAAVTLVEDDPRALAALAANIATVGLAGTRVAARPVERWLAADAAAVVAQDGPFDVVLADPPYALDAAALAAVLGRLPALLSPGALVVVERATTAGAPDWPASLEPAGPRRYGATTLHRAERAADPEPAPDGEPAQGPDRTEDQP
jgi:16S rRNA (guanine966-N2)-methyltransferase